MIQRFVTAEMWKRTAFLGWVGFFASMGMWLVSAIVAIIRGCELVGTMSMCQQPIEIPGAIVTLTIATLGIGHGGQWIKRHTEWTPTEIAQATVIKNGNDDAKKRRDEDEYGAEFAG